MTPIGAPSAVLQVRGIRHEYPVARRTGSVRALLDVSFDLWPGEFCSIVGRSGCGKTTLLRILAGLLRPTQGEAILDGEKVVQTSAHVAVVFQDYSRSLLPWRTVAGNVQLGLASLGLPRAAVNRRVDEYLEIVGLSASKNKYPWEMSGGMQQRVALARALARNPKVLLLDEPFGSLDVPTRLGLEDELLRVVRDLHIAVLMITHDVDEAVYLSDRVLVMRHDGTLRACGDNGTKESEVHIQLGRKREQIATRSDTLFSEYRSRILRELHVVAAGVQEEPVPCAK